MPDNSLILSIVLLAVFICMVVLLEWRRNRRLKAKEKPVTSVDELIARYGEPDDIIVVNPTQGNRSDGSILVYKEKKMLVVNSEEVPMNQITDVAFSNYANVYLPSDYLIQIFTTLPDKDIIRISVGTGESPVYAKEIVQQIKQAIND